MTHRENLIAALRRQPFERIPFHLTLCDSLQQEMIKRYGTANAVEVFDMSLDYIELPPPTHPIDHRKYHKDPDSLDMIDEWGVGYKSGSIAHFKKFISPMEDFDDPQQVWDYPFPDPDDEERWAAVKKHVDEVHAAAAPPLISDCRCLSLPGICGAWRTCWQISSAMKRWLRPAWTR